MIRNWTLVSAFATLALVSWAQPQGSSRPGTPPDAVRTIERGVPAENTTPPGLDPRQQRNLREERQQRENPSPANPELVRPGGEAPASPAQRREMPARPGAPGADGPRGRELPEAVRDRQVEQTPGAPAERTKDARIQEHQTRIREQLENRAARPSVETHPAAADRPERVRPVQTRPGAPAVDITPGRSATPGSADSPAVQTPSPDVSPGSDSRPSRRGTPAGRAASPSVDDAPAARTTPRGTPDRKALPVGTATPVESADTPSAREGSRPRPKVSPVPADATPFVPADMPDRLRDRRATPAAADDTPKAADAPVTPVTGESAAPSESTQPAGENAPRESRRPTAPPASATPPASTTPPSASPSPGATDTPAPTGTPGRAETPAPQASPSPAAGTPAADRPAGRPDRPAPSSSPTPSASPSTPAAPGEPSATPGPAAPPSTDAGKKALEERRKRPAVPASNVKDDELNQAAAALLGKKPEGTPPTSPAEVKLTPWIAPEVVTDPAQAEKIEPGDKPVLVMPPPGATPTPTPAPERITVDPTTIINNVQNITIAPTPPPAPTPGATPVATPPGVTPVPNNFRPDRGWVPYPGWRPPSNWQPPRGWTPPGGWSPPPGWKAPREWEVRLRRWGWSYIPRRGWVVPVQWTPPPDFVVPPDWYYMPSYAYDDYGLYDPSEVVVMAGHARPDLQVNININEVYMPPAPPPVQVLEAPPPPPRPAPPEPPRLPEQITNVEVVAEVLSRPRNPNGPRYQGPVLVTESVHFDFDSYAIKPESFPTLDAVGQALVSEMPDAILNVEGHTDSDGSDEYNQRLSEQRAWSVKSYLVQKFGLDPNRLIIVGYGERAPIASNATEQGKARNRRVEFENVTDLYKAQVVETAQP